MDKSQENMDISFVSSHNSNTYPIQQQTIRQDYFDYPPEHRVGDARRHVRIRNPHYITPGPSRAHAHYDNHQYTVNPTHDQSALHGSRIENVNPSSFSATPRRGPWRYMEVKNQWMPQNVHPENSHSMYPTHVPEDTLSDEFDESELGIGTHEGRPNSERIEKYERQGCSYMPSGYIKERERANFSQVSSQYPHPSTALQYARTSKRNVSEQQLATHQIIRPFLSPMRSDGINLSPNRQTINSTNLRKGGLRNISPIRLSRNHQNHLIQVGIGEDVESINVANETPEDCIKEAQIHRYLANNSSVSPRKKISKHLMLGLKSPSKRGLHDNFRSKNIESGLPDHIAANEEVPSYLSQCGNISPRTSISPRRISTPFLHRPRSLFKTLHATENTLVMPAHQVAPLLEQPERGDLTPSLRPSCKTMQICSTKETLSTKMPFSKSLHEKSGRPEMKKKSHMSMQLTSDEEYVSTPDRSSQHGPMVNTPNKVNLRRQTSNQSFSDEEGPTETTMELSPLKARVLPNKSNSCLGKEAYKPKIQKELASLLASNSFHGMLVEHEVVPQETEPDKGKKSNSAHYLRTNDNSNDSKVKEGITSGLLPPNNKRQLSKPSKMSSKMPGKARQKEDLNDSNIDSTKLAQHGLQDTIFKVPLPPRTRAKINKEGSEENINEEKTINTLIKESKSQEVAELQSELYLKNWTPKLKGKKLLLEGDLLDFGNENPNKGRYLTSKVIERLSMKQIKTKKRSYVLEGKLSVTDAEKYETPRFIINSFALGVPEKWEIYRDHWRKFIKEQRHMLLGSGASISSWSSASSVDQASGFLNSTKCDSLILQNRNPRSRARHLDADSFASSKGGNDSSLILPLDGTPIRYSWEYLAEGKEARLKKHDSLTTSEEQNMLRFDEKSSMNRDSSANKFIKSTTDTSVQDLNDLNNRPGPKELRKTRNKNKTGNMTSQNNRSTNIPILPSDITPKAQNIPTTPKLLKELFSIVKNDSKSRARKVGRCIVCGLSFSIPYIERHIANKHSSLVLDATSNTKNNSSEIKTNLTRSTYLRPRVVITRLTSKENGSVNLKTSPNTSSNAKGSERNTKGNKMDTQKNKNSCKQVNKPKDTSNKNKIAVRNSVSHLEKTNNDKHTKTGSKLKKANVTNISNLNDKAQASPVKTSKCKKLNKRFDKKDKVTKLRNERTVLYQGEKDTQSVQKPKHSSMSKKPSDSEDRQAEMVIRPKTIKDIQSNTRLLNALNKNHKDDIFVGKKSKHIGTEKETRQGPKDILADLFDSDSENDLSLHSARTPIGRFFDRSESKTPANNQEMISDEDIYHTFGKKDEYQQDAFINRKVKETRKRGRIPRALTSRQGNTLRTFTKSTRNTNEEQSNELVKPISKLLNQDENIHEGSDEDMESYFSEEPSTFTRSVADPPMGLLDLFNKEKAGKQPHSSIRRNY